MPDGPPALKVDTKRGYVTLALSERHSPDREAMMQQMLALGREWVSTKPTSIWNGVLALGSLPPVDESVRDIKHDNASIRMARRFRATVRDSITRGKFVGTPMPESRLDAIARPDSNFDELEELWARNDISFSLMTYNAVFHHLWYIHHHGYEAWMETGQKNGMTKFYFMPDDEAARPRLIDSVIGDVTEVFRDAGDAD